VAALPAILISSVEDGGGAVGFALPSSLASPSRLSASIARSSSELLVDALALALLLLLFAAAAAAAMRPPCFSGMTSGGASLGRGRRDPAPLAELDADDSAPDEVAPPNAETLAAVRFRCFAENLKFIDRNPILNYF